MSFALATRGSQLARWQAETTRSLLSSADPALDVGLEVVSSSGDRDQESALAEFGRIGIFTVEVDRAVLEGRARVAVHSLKDMLTSVPDGLVLAGCLGRGPVEDALVSRGDLPLTALPSGAKIATGSARRKALVLAERPDLQVIEIRGNVDTRLAKLDAKEANALILARAGLVRLGFQSRISEVLDTERFLPAVGQGIVGLVCRADDDEARHRVAAISDAEAFDEARAERALLAGLRGGCHVPACGHARAAEGSLSLRARVLACDGSETVEAQANGARDDAERLGDELARDLLERGAGRLIEAARA